MITNKGTIEYKIPKEWKKQIDKPFVTLLWKHLTDIWPYLNEGSKWQIFESEIMIEGTGGWADALKKTCEETNKVDLYNYWLSLPWYDSDLFDDELGTKMLSDVKHINSATIKPPKGYYDE